MVATTRSSARSSRSASSTARRSSQTVDTTRASRARKKKTTRKSTSPPQQPPKRRRIDQEPSLAHTQGSKRPDFSFRVSGIPQEWNSDKLQQILSKEGLSGVDVKSFASDFHGQRCVATVCFKEDPLCDVGTRGRTVSILDSTSSSSRTFLTIDAHFDGLTVLSSPSAENHKIDVIAISGLGSHPFGSFRDKSSDFMWLRDLLPLGQADARVMIYGYQSPVADSSNLQNLEDLAIKFQSTLERLVQDAPTKPMILIAHSLGGLIVKQSIIYMSSLKENRAHKIFQSIYGIAFFGVPHTGMDVESLRCMAGDGPNRELVESLSHHNSQQLTTLNRDFPKVFGKQTSREILSFYETELSPTQVQDANGKWNNNGPTKVLVSKPSATFAEPDLGRMYPIARSHSEMVKFGPNDQEYYNVFSKIKGMVDNALQPRPLYLSNEADEWIRTQCYSEKALEIVRLSGEQLSMEQCYINLIILKEHTTKSSDELAPLHSAHSVFERLNVREPDKKEQIKLENLFQPRETTNGQLRPPKRIIIRGRAGVGKTTLCKKIIYDFMHKKLWCHLYDRILWLPLRRLKLSESINNMRELFECEYFCLHSKPGNLADALLDAYEQEEGNRTLFLLDGLDEIWLDLSPDTKLHRFIRYLLRQPNVIVTSRPTVGSLSDISVFDLSLDTIGFYLDQQTQYVNAVQSETSAEILDFLANRPIVRDLARIPIQLDALCLAWSDLSSKPETMTELYRAIEINLWKKDCLRLKKVLDGVPVNEKHMFSLCDDEDIYSMTEEECLILESLAFWGLYKTVTVFNPNFRAELSRRLHWRGKRVDEILHKVSFMRSPTTSTGNMRGDYYFLHLTLQEYFAAKYFVRHWIKDQEFPCLAPKGQEAAQPSVFFQGRKYAPRFNMVWRFCVGLLSIERSDTKQKGRSNFLELVNQHPLDILGTNHYRLTMHLLHEIRPEDEFKEREMLEQALSCWLIFQSERASRDDDMPTTLASEPEFPEQQIIKILNMENKDLWSPLLLSLGHRFSLPGEVSNIINGWLQCFDTTQTVLEILCRFRGNLDEGTTKIIAAIAQDHRLPEKQLAVKFLTKYPNQSEFLINTLLQLLKDPEGDVRRAAAYALGRQSALSGPAVDSLAALIKDPKYNVREAAAYTLGQQSALSGSVVDSLAALLKDPDHIIRQDAAYALGVRSAYPEPVVDSLVALLKDIDCNVRYAAITALGKQLALSGPALDSLAALLKDPEGEIRQAAADALGQQSALSRPVLDSLAALLKDPWRNVRYAAADALRQQSVLSGPVVDLLAALLKDPAGDVRSAAEALGQQSDLSGSVVDSLAALLKDPEGEIRQAAAEALGQQSALSRPVLDSLAALLKDPEGEIRQAAADALGQQSALSRPVLDSLAALLKDPEDGVQYAAAEALELIINIPGLKISQEALDTIALSLNTGISLSPIARALPNNQGLYSALIQSGKMRTMFNYLLALSNKSHLSWYIWRKTLYLESSNRLGQGVGGQDISWIQDIYNEIGRAWFPLDLVTPNGERWDSQISDT